MNKFDQEYLKIIDLFESTEPEMSISALPNGGKKIVWSNGEMRCHDESGELHNENGPAAIYYGGLGDKKGTLKGQAWFIHGERHRLDGPAIEREDGSKEFYINNDKFDEEGYWKHPEVIQYNKFKNKTDYKTVKKLTDI